jgi:hypothetical protein
MQWLKDNAFLAGWLALPLTLFAAYAQNRGKPLKDIDWTWAIIYVTFGITLGVIVSQGFDLPTKIMAQMFAVLSFLAILRRSYK